MSLKDCHRLLEMSGNRKLGILLLVHWRRHSRYVLGGADDRVGNRSYAFSHKVWISNSYSISRSVSAVSAALPRTQKLSDPFERLKTSTLVHE